MRSRSTSSRRSASASGAPLDAVLRDRADREHRRDPARRGRRAALPAGRLRHPRGALDLSEQLRGVPQRAAAGPLPAGRPHHGLPGLPRPPPRRGRGRELPSERGRRAHHLGRRDHRPGCQGGQAARAARAAARAAARTAARTAAVGADPRPGRQGQRCDALRRDRRCAPRRQRGAGRPAAGGVRPAGSDRRPGGPRRGSGCGGVRTGWATMRESAHEHRPRAAPRTDAGAPPRGHARGAGAEAGVTNAAYRRLCAEQGAALRVRDDHLARHRRARDDHTLRMLVFDEAETTRRCSCTAPTRRTSGRPRRSSAPSTASPTSTSTSAARSPR